MKSEERIAKRLCMLKAEHLIALAKIDTASFQMMCQQTCISITKVHPNDGRLGVCQHIIRQRAQFAFNSLDG